MVRSWRRGGLALAFFTDPDGNPLYLAETATGWS